MWNQRAAQIEAMGVIAARKHWQATSLDPLSRVANLDRSVPEAFDRLMSAGRARGFDQLDFSALIQVVTK